MINTAARYSSRNTAETIAIAANRSAPQLPFTSLSIIWNINGTPPTTIISSNGALIAKDGKPKDIALYLSTR
jgi:hypothetical protein